MKVLELVVQDYKVELYSAYNTSAYSDTYTFFYEWDYPFTDYLRTVESYSAVHTDVELDPNDHYVVLSTCAYVFEDARSVLHGRLRPVMSAGGKPMAPLPTPMPTETAAPEETENRTKG